MQYWEKYVKCVKLISLQKTFPFRYFVIYVAKLEEELWGRKIAASEKSCSNISQ